MIPGPVFVTIGSVFPFDRLIRAADEWAARRADREILAQIGEGSYEPRHMPWVRRLDQDEFLATVRRARLIIAHAGMGSVITASRMGKPIVILPRLRERGEHNTDHQVDTANWLRSRPGIHVAGDEAALPGTIEAALAEPPEGIKTLPPHAPEAFIARIRAAILA